MVSIKKKKRKTQTSIHQNIDDVLHEFLPLICPQTASSSFPPLCVTSSADDFLFFIFFPFPSIIFSPPTPPRVRPPCRNFHLGDASRSGTTGSRLFLFSLFLSKPFPSKKHRNGLLILVPAQTMELLSWRKMPLLMTQYIKSGRSGPPAWCDWATSLSAAD